MTVKIRLNICFWQTPRNENIGYMLICLVKGNSSGRWGCVVHAWVPCVWSSHPWGHGSTRPSVNFSWKCQNVKKVSSYLCCLMSFWWLASTRVGPSTRFGLCCALAVAHVCLWSKRGPYRLLQVFVPNDLVSVESREQKFTAERNTPEEELTCCSDPAWSFRGFSVQCQTEAHKRNSAWSLVIRRCDVTLVDSTNGATAPHRIEITELQGWDWDPAGKAPIKVPALLGRPISYFQLKR